MLEPITSLAFSMQSAKGVYALLLGSGISRAAKIPTGWEITLELVRKIAAAQGHAEPLPGDAADAWYRATFNAAPDYAQLLDSLAKTPSERQQVLKAYIEPDSDARARGEKRPTAAHRAIGRLVASGYVRVIITTNFDQLLEEALREEGISPTVITSAHIAAGAVPLVHSGCTVIKVHGDYLDTRIRNTPAELGAYEADIDKLLDRVFDEFGLIVCGWSAEWDEALRQAIERAPSRRYSTYWATRGAPGAAAASLIAHRAAVGLPVNGADEFFGELAQKVAALETFNAPHPLSAELAVQSLKEFLADPKDRIRLDDLIGRELDRLLEAIDAPQFATDSFAESTVDDRVRRYEAACSTLIAMAFTAGRWSTGDQANAWVDMIKTLGGRAKDRGGHTLLIDLMLLPASLVLHAYGLGAVAGGHNQALGRLVTVVIDFGGTTGKLAAGDRLNAGTLIRDGGQDWAKKIKGYDTRVHAMSDWLYDVLKPIAKRTLRDERASDRVFLTLELVLAMGFAERLSPVRQDTGWPFWAPTGRYAHDAALRSEILNGWREEAKRTALTSLSMMAGLTNPPRLDEVEALAARAWYG